MGHNMPAPSSPSPSVKKAADTAWNDIPKGQTPQAALADKKTRPANEINPSSLK